MKNIKRLTLSLLVGIIAIGVSAYKNEQSKSNQEKFLIQASTNKYILFNDSPDPEACFYNTTELNCIYKITYSGKTKIRSLNQGEHYSASQIIRWLTKTPYPYIVSEQHSSRGLYEL